MRKTLGFTLIEIMVVLAVIAILMSLAVPNTHHRVIQSQVKESIELLEKYKKDIASFYQFTGDFPVDNNAMGMPEANKIMGNYLAQVEVINGALHLTLGNKIHKQAMDKKLSLRPIYVVGSVGSPVSWLCGYDEVPNGMAASGDNLSDIEIASLPISCR